MKKKSRRTHSPEVKRAKPQRCLDAARQQRTEQLSVSVSSYLSFSFLVNAAIFFRIETGWWTLDRAYGRILGSGLFPGSLYPWHGGVVSSTQGVWLQQDRVPRDCCPVGQMGHGGFFPEGYGTTVWQSLDRGWLGFPPSGPGWKIRRWDLMFVGARVPHARRGGSEVTLIYFAVCSYASEQSWNIESYLAPFAILKKKKKRLQFQKTIQNAVDNKL